MESGNNSRTSRRQRVAGVIIDHSHENILLIKRTFSGNGMPTEEFWTLPGGGQKSGETQVEALRREIQDEVSLDVTFAIPLFSVNNVVRPPGIPRNLHLQYQDEHYFAVVWRGEPRPGRELLQKMERYRAQSYRLEWIPIDELAGMKGLRERKGPQRLAEFLNVNIQGGRFQPSFPLTLQ